MKIRKATLTGGGRATRLHPITTTINKHLLPLANKPMIFHAIEKAVEAGITEIFINVNPGEQDLQEYIGDGGHWGISITFFEQTGGPQGIAHVVQEAKKFIGSEPFLFFLSDNILLGSLKDLFAEFHNGDYDCMLALSQVPDPERFGIPYFDENGNLINVVEKPANPPNNLAITGIYVYGPDVFFDAFKKIQKSPRGEYEISSIHALFLEEKKRVGYKEITGWWKDTGKTTDLLIANQLLLDIMPAEDMVNKGMIDPDAIVKGLVRVGVGTQIKKGTVLSGPLIIGENCILEDCVVGPHVTIGQGTEIKNATIKNSIILDNCQIDCKKIITDSLIGKKVVIRNASQTGSALIIGDKSVVEF
jgi:glucose-1-phosphate thymidylyltransferase